MRVLHTADWHLGNSMHDIDRSGETRMFLSWLKDKIVELGAEALVVAGDIFDVPNPSNEARKQFFDFLASLIGTKCKSIEIIGGNHDSGMMLDAQKNLLDALDIHIVGSLHGGVVGNDIVREMKDDSGNVIGICAAVPFMREADLRSFASDESKVMADDAGRRLYGEAFEAADKLRGGRAIPIIATGHLYASKLERETENEGDMREHGVRDIVGNLGKVSVDVFPDGFDYVALGHIHYTSRVAGSPKVRYSGSPFVLGFDEAGMPHHVLLADIGYGKEVKVEKIEVPGYFVFRRIGGSAEEIRAKLWELRNMPSEKPVKVEICFKYDKTVSIRELLKNELDTDAFEVVSWKAILPESISAGEYGSEFLENVRSFSDEEIFRRLVMKNLGVTEATDDVKRKFDEFWPIFRQVADEIALESREGLDENN